jgi:hypothetical protein
VRAFADSFQLSMGGGSSKENSIFVMHSIKEAYGSELSLMIGITIRNG